MKELTLFDQPSQAATLDRYHNTNGLSGDDLKQKQMKTGSQNRKVLDFFRSHSYENFTPWEVNRALGMNNTPITSIRRAITDLTEMGYLRRTDIQRPGLYKEPCYAWQLA